MLAEKVKLLKAYGYERAMIYACDETIWRVADDCTSPGIWLETTKVPRDFVRELEQVLTKQAGWNHADNKTLFIFELGDERFAMTFRDWNATFITWKPQHWNDRNMLPGNLKVPENACVDLTSNL